MCIFFSKQQLCIFFLIREVSNEAAAVVGVGTAAAAAGTAHSIALWFQPKDMRERKNK